ncbi:NAD-dependent deacylase [candidate division KSB1 bacterium]
MERRSLTDGLGDKGRQIASAAEMIASAGTVSVLTGAGISAESGVPTFRGEDGLWKGYRAEELATPGAFRRDPEMVWRWYDWRRCLLEPLQPNPGHFALAELEGLAPRFNLVTQNVDGLHASAGSSDPIEIHGNIWLLRCLESCAGSPGSGWEDRRAPLPELPPPCPHCGGPARPGVVWYGEQLPPEALRRAQEALHCDVMLVVGTSAIVQPAASFALVARSEGAKIIEVNPEETPLTSSIDIYLQGRSGELLPELMTELRRLKD